MLSIGNAGKILGFQKPMPSFLGGASQRVNSVQSIYSGGQAYCTISPALARALKAYRDMKTQPDLGGVGTKNTQYFAEVQTNALTSVAVQNPLTHIAVISSSGSIQAGILNPQGTMIQYDITSENGAVLALALMPKLMASSEFSDAYTKFEVETDQAEMVKQVALMSENAYRRLIDSSCPEKIELADSVSFRQISMLAINNGTYTPDAVVRGSFRTLASSAGTSGSPVAIIDPQCFVGKYKFSDRELMPEEAALVPELPEWYVVSEEALTICQHVKETTEALFRVRNIMLRGPAGTGKTQDAMAVPVGTGQPYVSETCNPSTEVFDLVGQVVPVTEEDELKNMGFTFNWEDVMYDPEGTYAAITGQPGTRKNVNDCMDLIIRHMKEDKNGGTRYRYVESGLVKALRNGWVCEIREPSVIVNQGVLVGLNTILEQDGEIVLPITGTRFKRHPDAIVILTTNSDYEGCRNMNQSVVDRMDLVIDYDEISVEVMVARAMKRTGETDEDMVREMATIVKNVKETLKNQGDTSGEAGMRSLISWIVSTKVTKNPYKSATLTLFPKATTDAKYREALKSTFLDTSNFYVA